MSAHRRPGSREETPATRRAADPGGQVTMPIGRQGARGRPHRWLPLFLGVAFVLVVATAGHTVVNNNREARRAIKPAAVPTDSPALGMVYAGLTAAQPGAVCAGSYELPTPDVCTHGPDPAPPGYQVDGVVPPVTDPIVEAAAPTRESAVPSDAEVVRDEGGTALVPDAPALVPDPAPGEADFVMGSHGVACAGDGRTGNRVQVLYLHEFGTPSRYTKYLGSIQTWSAGVDGIIDASAGETGGSRHVRYVTTPQCRVDVAEVQVPAGGLRSFTGNIAALQQLGYNRTDRKYLLFADTHVYCGIATFVADKRFGAGNRNNGGPSYGRVDAGCWSTAVATHELVHTLGAVLRGSPNSTDSGHCTDGYDLLCSQESSDAGVRTICPKKHELRLDCNHDDYFSTDPRPGSYLARNWNAAQNQFLLQSDGGDDLPPGVPTVAPTTPADLPPSRASTGAPGIPDSNAPAPGGDESDGGGDAPPGTPTGGGSPGGVKPGSDGGGQAPAVQAQPSVTPSAAETPASAARAPVDRVAALTRQAPPVQAVIEVRDPTSTSVRLVWSAAAPKATYEVAVDGVVIATTTSTRARLIGLRPDSKSTVTVHAAAEHYLARATAETAPPARPAQNDWFVLTNSLTGGAADLYAARAADGTPIVLNDAEGDAQQQWKLSPAGDDSYILHSQASDKCIAPLDGNPVEGAPLVQAECTDVGDQRWLVQYTDYGFNLATPGSRLVLGVGGQRFGTHRVLVLQKANQSRHQSWTALPG